MLICPVCSRALYLTHDAINLQGCVCGAALVRKEGEFAVSPTFIIQEHVSSIHPGTEGIWQNRKFRVAGRVRAWIEEFVFNYWTIVFGDGSIGYLGEGYGLYAIYMPLVLEKQLRPALLEGLRVGNGTELIKGSSFLLERKYACTRWELEGEAWLPSATSSFNTYELASAAGRRIEIMEFEDGAISSFDVAYLSFGSLGLTNLRSYEPSPKDYTCTKCRKLTLVQTYPYAQSFACVHCQTLHSLQSGTDVKKEGPASKLDLRPDLAIGSTGLLGGIPYTVVGFMVKEELKIGSARWNEYTLFHPEEGYAFLSEYNGHWIYARERGDAPVIENRTVEQFDFGSEPFRLFNKYSFECICAIGEFPYNVFNDEHKDVREFISPPEAWIYEHSAKEGIVWYLGEHLAKKELAAAFEGILLPDKTGVGALEPRGFVAPAKIAFVTLVAVVLLSLAHLLTVSGKEERVIIDGAINLSDSAYVSMFTSEKFELEKNSSNLEVSVFAPVDNNWFELTATLVNAVTGAEHSLQQAVEYYHGYEGGSSWSEGSRREEAYLNSVPKGVYYLELEGASGTSYNQYVPRDLKSYQLTVTYDVPNHRNLLICFAALVLWGFFHYLLVQYNEKRRWSGSEFSPFNEDDED